MIHEVSTYPVLLEKWMKANLTEEQVKAELVRDGCDPNETDELTRLFKKYRMNERTKRGLRLLVIGCFIGFVSCVLTVMGAFPEIKGFILYGLTSIGITLALWGGYYVFE